MQGIATITSSDLSDISLFAPKRTSEHTESMPFALGINAFSSSDTEKQTASNKQTISLTSQEVTPSDIPKTFIEKDIQLLGEPVNTGDKQAKTFLISIFIHLALLAALILLAKTSQLTMPAKVAEVKAIKSYLYKKPVKKVQPVQAPTEKATESQPTAQTKAAKPLETKPPEPKPVEPQPKAKQTEQAAKVTPQSPAQSTPQTAQELKAAQPKTKSFSAYGQLNKLRNSINQQMLEKDFQEYQAVRSHSKMHAQPFPVPHSEVQLTPEQIKEKNTSNYGGGTITKLDNGLCIIEREQFIGSPVEASTSAFNCGESKFDASFREHMKKVQEKLTPVKPKQ
ncbi:hypothetical protein [Litorilituus sediminis]|uniref:Uncharacterized protein n=1 Tax=Litorilituus sediminis TaxID=718192 RepID=A0A4P6P3M8_9GAMM|nr:hypothetical protein [Litorilituus sediminis]QBG36146.1 hypothetical protein EMK97_10695 [Litorilituus sediminis]